MELTPEQLEGIANGTLNEDGTPKAPANDGKDPVDNPKGDKEEPKFTQSQLDAIIQERLRRAEEKAAADAKAKREAEERKRLEDSKEFESLATKYKEELETLKASATKATKVALLTKAGYNEEQIERYSKFVEGDTEETMKASVEQLKLDVPPKAPYVDPAANNHQRETPKPKGADEKGRSLFQRLKAEGRTGR